MTPSSRLLAGESPQTLPLIPTLRITSAVILDHLKPQLLLAVTFLRAGTAAGHGPQGVLRLGEQSDGGECTLIDEATRGQATYRGAGRLRLGACRTPLTPLSTPDSLNSALWQVLLPQFLGSGFQGSKKTLGSAQHLGEQASSWRLLFAGTELPGGGGRYKELCYRQTPFSQGNSCWEPSCEGDLGFPRTALQVTWVCNQPKTGFCQMNKDTTTMDLENR